MPSSSDDPRLTRLTAIATALPETTVERYGSHATFRVRGKVFAYYLDDHHGDGIVAICVRTARGENAEWIKHDGRRFYLPAYIGPRGWLGARVDLGRIDWSEIQGFVEESYRMAAPKRLLGRIKPSSAPARTDRRRRPE